MKHGNYERVKNLSPHIHTIELDDDAPEVVREQYPAAPAEMQARIEYTARRNAAIQDVGSVDAPSPKPVKS